MEKNYKSSLFIKLIFPFLAVIAVSGFITWYFGNKFVLAYSATGAVSHSVQFLTVKFFLTVTALQSIIVFFLYLFFVRKIIIHPINRIIRLMKHVGAGGDFNDFEISESSEFFELTEQFKKMISDLKKTNTELEETREKNFQLEKLQILTNLSSGIAHEINNPLNNITQYLEVMEKKIKSDEDAKKIIVKIDGELSRISSITKKFGEFSKLSFNAKTEINLDIFVDEIKDFLEYYFKKIKFNFIYQNNTGGAHVKIMKDPVKYIIINILKNAIESLDCDNGTITLRIFRKSEILVFEVLDTGSGISEEMKNDIFKPFVTGKENGSGLGLAISRKLAELCGGCIKAMQNDEAINKDVKGSKFIFEVLE